MADPFEIRINANVYSITIADTVVLSIQGVSAIGNGWESDVDKVPGPTNSLQLHHFAPYPCVLKSIRLWAITVPVTAGTYTFAITGGGTNLLAAATFDLTSLTADTLESLVLAVAANLILAANAEIEVAIVSNNADLAIDTLRMFVDWDPR